MRIESQSLSGYLYNRLDLIEFPGTPEDLWKEILIFPGESWPKDFGKKGASILDPSRVLGRMFCVKIDKYMKKYLRKDPLRINVPISWLLRIAEEKEWTPEVKLDLDTRSNKLEEGVFEVVLALTVTASIGEETAFLCEIQQAGIFTIADVEEVQLAHMLGAFCPNVLFPYAREAVSNLVNRGTFPQLNLAPVNFDALFAQYMQQRAAQEQQATADA